jgi:hypothetical protein
MVVAYTRFSKSLMAAAAAAALGYMAAAAALDTGFFHIFPIF